MFLLAQRYTQMRTNGAGRLTKKKLGHSWCKCWYIFHTWSIWGKLTINQPVEIFQRHTPHVWLTLRLEAGAGYTTQLQMSKVAGCGVQVFFWCFLNGHYRGLWHVAIKLIIAGIIIILNYKYTFFHQLEVVLYDVQISNGEHLGLSMIIRSHDDWLWLEFSWTSSCIPKVPKGVCFICFIAADSWPPLPLPYGKLN